MNLIKRFMRKYLGRDPIFEERKKYVRKYMPDLFSGKYKSILYVGANPTRQQFLKDFEESGYKRIVILEAFSKNIKFLKEKFERESRHHDWINDDVRNIEKLQLSNFDVVFFWHGIEHLPEKDIEPTLKKLEAITKHLIVIGTPWGSYPQHDKYGNTYEIHQTIIYPPMLKQYGYKTETLGKKDDYGSNITAWKYLNQV